MTEFAEQPGSSPVAQANALVIALYPQVQAAHAELSELDDFRAVAEKALGRTSTDGATVDLTADEKALILPDVGLPGEGSTELDRAELSESVRRALKAWEGIHASYRNVVIEARRDLIRMDEQLDDRTYFGVAAALYALDNPDNSQASQEADAQRLEMERLIEELQPGAPVIGFDADEMRGTSELGPLIAGRVKSIGRTAVTAESSSAHIGMQVELTRQGRQPLVVARTVPSVLTPDNPAYLWVGDKGVGQFRLDALGRGVDPREIQMAVAAIGPYR
jgi:hypothetical protein